MIICQGSGTALMYAAHEGHPDMLQLLLQYGMPAAEVMCCFSGCISGCDQSPCTVLKDLIAFSPSRRLAVISLQHFTVLHWVVVRTV